MSERHEEKLDHRILVASRRRAAMRSRILRAIMEISAAQPISAPSVDDVIRVAGISKGGFYRYFSSTSEALAMIGHELAEELASLIEPAYDVLTDPLQRACVGTVLVLKRAAGDPIWAEYMLRADLPRDNSSFLNFMHRDLSAGIRSGQFRFDNADLASELVMGINQVLMRGISTRASRDQDDYIDFGVTFLLRSLGVEQIAIDEVLLWSKSYFAGLPNNERWWDVPLAERAERLSGVARATGGGGTVRISVCGRA
ncbi:TetR/AcrR family transcriptional regulator [Sphingobium phenoxybenzoativorans]|uniref:TetR/AcrR family transcriptional regulator n=1 Tax=Sphingobium phenoxybenzoativorans TaxID=1592790 RepID=A0A975Q1M7_9SPHN|nr:TetR/AcrR family transcriptional regulator [Sphingobium phenoxybenzoativorans]QUT05577.1 TetR/AcrR family transcriptional regulator [Sphingobium phenoxybenzoativorans]